MTDQLFDIRYAIQTFLEQKLEGEVTDAGMFIQGPRQANIEVEIGENKYNITIEEM